MCKRRLSLSFEQLIYGGTKKVINHSVHRYIL